MKSLSSAASLLPLVPWYRWAISAPSHLYIGPFVEICVFGSAIPYSTHGRPFDDWPAVPYLAKDTHRALWACSTAHEMSSEFADLRKATFRGQ